FTNKEISEAFASLKTGKAADEYLITTELLLYTFDILQPFWVQFFNACYLLKYFPDPLKIDLTILIPKPGKKTYNVTSSYRPIAILPIIGKILEFLVLQRLVYWEQQSNAHGRSTYGFEQGKTHLDAVGEIVSNVERAFSRKKVAILIRMDVKQAFPSAWHPAIFNTLIQGECPPDIVLLLKSFLTNRISELLFSGARKRKFHTASTAQGARLSPNLWKAVNIYISNAIGNWLAQARQEGLIVSFADDNSILIIGPSEKSLSNRASDLISFIKHAMMKFKIFFDLSSDKIEIMGFSRRVKTWFPNVHVIDYDNNHITLPVKKETKLLGVWLDSRLTWHQELAVVAQKSLSTLFELKRIVKTTWGLS
ncbi:unnamed protein product, partial [Heterosigma akashiwo]